MDISNPHDKFFKQTFSNIEAAKDFITGTFPENILKNLDLSTLELDTNTYTDSELKEHFSDLVSYCFYGNKIPIRNAILFEHKSTIPEYPHLQIFRYMLKIWELNVKQGEILVPVIPVIFYHGKEKWEMKPFIEYFKNAGDLSDFIPAVKYLLTDCSKYSDEQIKDEIFNTAITKIAILLMKNVFDEEKIMQKLIDILNLGVLYLKEEKGLRYFEAVLRYMLSNIDKEKRNMVFKTIKEISFEGGNSTMTIAEEIFKEGEEKGGYQKAIDTAKRMLTEGFDIALISKITDLPVKEIENLKVTHS